jgi:hypothetical protein
MIVRIAPEQIATIWEYVRPGIMETMLPVAEQNHETIQRVLRSLLAEDMQLWLGLENPEDFTDKSIYGVMVTTIYSDLISESKSLVIYSLFETREIPPMIWLLGMRKLGDFAAAMSCSQIIAYTDIPRIITLAKSLGFKTMTFLRKEI